MIILLETFGGILLFLAIGFFFLWVFASVISGLGRQDPYQRLQSIISTRQIERRDERVEILNQIRAMEKCPDGTYSRPQQQLWNQYYRLEAEDKELTHHERNQLVDARGYISDEYADIIEGKQ